MTSFRKLAIAAAVGAAALTATPAMAITVDFTSGWAGANGLTTYSQGGITLQALPTGSTLQFEAGEGIGIDANIRPVLDDPKEVDSFEEMRVDLPGTSVTVLNIDFLNLYFDFGSPFLRETIEVQVNGAGSWLSFDAILASPGGLRSTGLIGSGVDFLSIRGAQGPDFLFADASLARISYIPEPDTLALLGLSFLGLGLARRRQA